MSNASLWWVIAGALVTLELLTLTFYLLMLALGAAVGALAAHLGAPLPVQLAAAALASAVAVAACYLARRRQPGDPSARADRSVNLDVGEIIHIDAWTADGTASVRYRGAPWTAVPASHAQPPQPGPHRVTELVGSRLLVEPV